LRGIVVIAIKRIAAVGVAGLVAGIENAPGLQRTPDPRKNIRKPCPRHMQQTGIGPDAVIGLDLIEFMKQQRLDGAAEML
jgi:hypothetical protein